MFIVLTYHFIIFVFGLRLDTFVSRHAHLQAAVPENNAAVTSSYVMVTPDGCF